jgi:CBS domain containing-hemolysin-like protein
MAPFLLATRAITRLLTRDRAAGLTRGELAAMIAVAPTEGAISVAESRILASLLDIHRVTLGEVHTPGDLIFAMDAEATAGDLLAAPEADAFSRIPLSRGGAPAGIVGYVAHRDVLKALALGGSRSEPLETFVRPLPRLAASLPVRKAVERLLDERESVALVEDGGAVVGLATLEDLLEAMLGVEITDEPEDVVELRRAANEARRRRTERLRRHRQERDARLGLAAAEPAPTGPERPPPEAGTAG